MPKKNEKRFYGRSNTTYVVIYKTSKVSNDKKCDASHFSKIRKKGACSNQVCESSCRVGKDRPHITKVLKIEVTKLEVACIWGEKESVESRRVSLKRCQLGSKWDDRKSGSIFLRNDSTFSPEKRKPYMKN